MKKKYFGTDGIRGQVGQHPITPDFVLKLGWATGRVFSGKAKQPILIGKDTRISGYMFESALEAGLAAAGVDIQLVGPMPTPGIAYLTRTFRAQAGIVISASHNPYYDNGIKFFSAQGTKLADAVELEIEKQMTLPMTTVESSSLGKAVRIDDAAGRYIEFCKATIPSNMDFSGTKIVVDCANGATYHIAPYVFEEIGATVIRLGTDPSGLNINDACGATNPEQLQQAVLINGADFGIALDGDGDRLIMVDHLGEIVDGDELIYIIAKSRLDSGRMTGPVIGTLMSNLGLEQALSRLGLDFKRAAVGDRYVMEMLMKYSGMLGGENSGHIICLDRTTTGDGIVSALQVMVGIWTTGRTLHELKSGMKKFPQVLVNVRVDKQADLAAVEPVQRAKSDVERMLNGQGRVLLRASGTEPLIRVMVEGEDEPTVTRLANRLAAVVSEELAS
jgi:phosphoglucosamine mutase